MSQEHRSTSGLPPEIQRDRDVERFAKQAKLPPYMWDTLDGLSALARFMDCVRSAKSERPATPLAKQLLEACAIGMATIVAQVGAYETLRPYLKGKYDRLEELHKLASDHGAWPK